MKRYISLRWKENLLAGIFLCMNVLSTTICSFTFMKSMDAIMEGNKQRFLYLLVCQGILWIITYLTYYLGGVFQGEAQKKMSNDMRHDISRLLVRKSYQQYEEHTIGEYISWYSNDVAQVGMWAWNSFFALITSLSQVVITEIALFMIHWALAVTTLIGGIVLIVISILFEKKITEKANATSIVSETFYNGMKNLLSGFQVMKNFHIMNQFMVQSDECSEEKSETDFQYTKIQVMSNSYLLLGDAAFRILVIAICGLLILKGNLALSALVGVSTFMPVIFDGLTNAVCYKNSIVAAKPFFEKFQKQYEELEVSAAEIQSLEDLSRSISISNVGYSYKEHPVFQNLSFKIEKGKKYALIGPSGSGKTTLMKILLGQLRGYEGEIFYDDADIKDCNTESITDKVSYIEQNVYLFDTTIRNNITLWEDFTEEQISKALYESALYDDMKLFPQGLDTIVGENGKNLSGGQRQRIAVARALIHGKKIIFVDEGTSALDRKNAEQIEERLLENQDLTLLLISHHLDDKRKEQFDDILELAQYT